MNITIAVNDFQQENWGKQFFPEDLPQEWRFDYYSNEFDSIFLSKLNQQNIGKTQIDEWLSESSEDFLVVLEDGEIDSDSMNVECSLLCVQFADQSASSHLDSVVPGLILQQAEIVSSRNFNKTACVLRVNSARAIKNTEIKQLLMHLYSKCADYEQVFLFFGQQLQDIETINTARIINDLL